MRLHLGLPCLCICTWTVCTTLVCVQMKHPDCCCGSGWKYERNVCLIHAQWMCNNAPNKQCSLSRADKPKLTTCMLVSHIPVPSPSFPSLAVQAITQLPITCSTGHRPASHHLQFRPSPSFPSLAVQALAQLPITCSTGHHPASHCLQ